MVAVGVALVRSGVGSLLRKPEWIASKETFNVALLIVPIVVIWAMSPARWSARYHIATTGLMIGLCAWASGRRGFARLGEGAAAAAILGALASNYWASRCVLTPKELGTLMKIPYPEREVTPGGTFSTAYFTVGSCVTKDVGLARDRELGKGDVLAFPDNFGNFPAIFWNDWYSNRAVWIPEGPEFIANAEKANAKWIYVTFGDANYSKLKAPGSGWQEVGTMNVENWGAAFRRAPK
jgi:hypothetical protein